MGDYGQNPALAQPAMVEHSPFRDHLNMNLAGIETVDAVDATMAGDESGAKLLNFEALKK